MVVNLFTDIMMCAMCVYIALKFIPSIGKDYTTGETQKSAKDPLFYKLYCTVLLQIMLKYDIVYFFP